jgi:hypothetical protein
MKKRPLFFSINFRKIVSIHEKTLKKDKFTNNGTREDSTTKTASPQQTSNQFQSSDQFIPTSGGLNQA